MHLFLSTLVACSTATDTGPAPDTGDSGDTAEEIVPVWKQYPIQTNAALQGIYASGSGVYVVGKKYAWSGNGGEFTYMDIDVDDADITDLWGQGKDEDAVLAASTSLGTVAQYTGTGGWTTGTMGDTSELKGVGGDSPTNLYAVGWGRAWSYDGAAWTYEDIPDANAKLNDVYGVGAKAFAIGEEGYALVRSDGTWKESATGVEVALHGISGSGVNDVWAVGEGGTVLHFDGTTWTTEEDVPTTATLWAVFVPEEGVVYAVGSGGTALRRKGGAWESLPTGIVNGNALYAVHGVSASNVWASGATGMVIQYKDE